MIVAAREQQPFDSVDDLTHRTRLGSSVLTKLSNADAFGSLSLNRREATWHALADRTPMPLFDHHNEPEKTVALPPMSSFEEVAADYQSTGLSLRRHPVSFLRATFDKRGVVTAAELPKYPADRWVRVGGLVIMRQRPATAKGVTFVTLEDETGICNLIVWQNVWQRYRRVAGKASVMLASGPLQRQNEVIHVVVRHLEDASDILQNVPLKSRNFH